MKDLLKICRYIIMAVLTVCLVLAVNIIFIVQLMEKLGQEQLDSILLEGGGTLNWAALESGVVQQVDVYKRQVWHRAEKIVSARRVRAEDWEPTAESEPPKWTAVSNASFSRK